MSRKPNLPDRLRDLRKRRGFTMKEVADATESVSLEPRGVISQPYLAQVESGREANIGLSKLLTLSAIYCARIETLIDAAPADLRERLRAELEDRLRRGMAQPAPVWYLPQRVRELAPAIHEHLRRLIPRDESVSIRFGYEDEDRATVRHYCTLAVAPALLRTQPELATRFWHTFLDIHRDERPEGQFMHPAYWRRITENFCDWLLYQETQPDVLFDPLRAWSICWRSFDAPMVWPDMVALRMTARFADRSLDRRYRFENLPLIVVHEVNWRMLAGMLRQGAPPETKRLRLIDTGPPVEAVRDYVHELTARLTRKMDDAPLDQVLATARAILAEFPDQAGEPDPGATAAVEYIRRHSGATPTPAE